MARWSAIWLTVLSGQVFAQTSAPANNSIQQSDLKADLYFLASDAMQGRLTNTPENRLAAEFIKSRFARMGLQAVGPNESFINPLTSSQRPWVMTISSSSQVWSNRPQNAACALGKTTTRSP